MRMRAIIAGAALVAAGLGSTESAAAASAGGAAVVVRARFSATMPDRFGIDADGDGLIDLPNTPGYVDPGGGSACGLACGPLFTLRLDATPSTAAIGGAALPLESYRWEIAGPGSRRIVRKGAMPQLEVRLLEGTYRVSLEVTATLPWGTARDRSTREVVVEDLLVVAIGDSYAGGEGNPERPQGERGAAAWADAAGDDAVEEGHAAAHRSTASWPALVALALERQDPGSSVTFVSVAASGARVEAGLLGPQPGVSPIGQLEQVAGLVGDRRIDLLLVSIGGNDVGFSRIVRGLVDADRLADPVCYGTDLRNVWEAAVDGDWNRGSGLRFALPWGVGCRQTRLSGRPVLAGLQGLGVQLDRLAGAVEDRLDVGAVYLMEYPDPTGGPVEGEGCGEIVGDVTPPFRFHEIDRAEQEAALERVVQPLNRILAEAAARHGWGFIGGIAAEFASGHGYCGSRPEYAAASAGSGTGGFLGDSTAGSGRWYRHPVHLEATAALSQPGVSWYRTAAQSVLLQGPGNAWETAGTLHPNELGHMAIARSLLAALREG